jgi:hypothetical protein
VFGRGGVERFAQWDLAADERGALLAAADVVRATAARIGAHRRASARIGAGP